METHQSGSFNHVRQEKEGLSLRMVVSSSPDGFAFNFAHSFLRCGRSTHEKKQFCCIGMYMMSPSLPETHGNESWYLQNQAGKKRTPKWRHITLWNLQLWQKHADLYVRSSTSDSRSCQGMTCLERVSGLCIFWHCFLDLIWCTFFTLESQWRLLSFKCISSQGDELHRQFVEHDRHFSLVLLLAFALFDSESHRFSNRSTETKDQKIIFTNILQRFPCCSPHRVTKEGFKYRSIGKGLRISK